MIVLKEYLQKAYFEEIKQQTIQKHAKIIKYATP